MREVRIQKGVLETVLQDNLEKHKVEYDEAMVMYRRDFAEQLAKKAAELESGRLPDQYFEDMPIPQSHEAEYQRVLEMLALSEDDTIKLTQTEFTQYVQDQWGWKGQFEATTMNYRSKGL